MKIPPQVFRKYDIRGVVGKHLTTSVYYHLGKGFATYLNQKFSTRTLPAVAVGRDARLDSASYQRAFLEGLVDAGCEAIDVGMVPTPVVYYAQKKLGTTAAAVVTASHNPKEYNGLKLRTNHGPVYSEDLQTLHQIVLAEDYTNGAGQLRAVDIAPAYVQELTDQIHLARPMKVAIDTGNGAAGPLATRLLRDLGCTVVERNTEPDGTFPNHVPDPTIRKFMRELSETVTQTGCDVGIGLDGDGDRIGSVDESGLLWSGDRLLRLLAQDVLEQHPGTPVIFDVKCSQTLVQDVVRLGGKPIMWRTGYPFIVSKMAETGAKLGGEMSGHIYLADRYYGFDDGLYCGARLLELLSHRDMPMGRLVPDNTLVSTPEIRLPCDDSRKFDIVDAFTRYYQGKRQLIDIDGARVSFDDGWVLVRASNTEPVLVIRAEAGSESGLHAMFEEVQAALANAGLPHADLHAAYLECR